MFIHYPGTLKDSGMVSHCWRTECLPVEKENMRMCHLWGLSFAQQGATLLSGGGTWVQDSDG